MVIPISFREVRKLEQAILRSIFNWIFVNKAPQYPVNGVDYATPFVLTITIE